MTPVSGGTDDARLDPRLLDHNSANSVPPLAFDPNLTRPTNFDPVHASPAQTALTTSNAAVSWKRYRACQACRNLKVRCDPDQTDPGRPCQRCLKTARQCVFTEPVKRQRKETRVAELERKLDALTSALDARQHDPRNLMSTVTSNGSSPPVLASPALSHASQHRHASVYAVPPPESAQPGPWLPHEQVDHHSRKRQRLDEVPAAPHIGPTHTIKDPRAPPRIDIAQLITPEALVSRIKAVADPRYYDSVLRQFTVYMLPTMPVLVLPDGTTAAALLQEKPVLFLSILSVAGVQIFNEAMHDAVCVELLNILADCIIRSSVKSLELVQAMMVNVLWCSVSKSAHPNIYQLCQIMGSMALEIGLGRKHDPHNARRNFGRFAKGVPQAQSSTQPINSETIESRRTWLCCYYICACGSMIHRRPSLLQSRYFSQECMDVLDRSPDALPSDRFLVQHVRLQCISDEITSRFAMDDSSAPSVSIRDPGIAYAVEVFEGKLDAWKRALSVDLEADFSIQLHHHRVQLYLHEVAMHVNHNVDDFRLPFTEESLRAGSQYSETPTDQEISALSACMRAAHSALQVFVEVPIDTLRYSPAVSYTVGTFYTIVILAKLDSAAAQSGSTVAKFITREDIQISRWIDRVYAKIQEVAKIHPHGFTSTKSLHIVGMLRDWVRMRDSKGKGSEGADTAHPPHDPGSGLQVLSEAATASADFRLTSSSSMPSSHGAPGSEQTLHDSFPAMERTSTTTSRQSEQLPSIDNYSLRAGTSRSAQDPTYKMVTNGAINYDQYLPGDTQIFDQSNDLSGWLLGDGLDAFMQDYMQSMPPMTGW